jgi:hypothetical protein
VPDIPEAPDPSAAAAEAFFAGRPTGLAAYRRVRAALEAMGPVEVRVAKSQVAFRRRRGFAYLWLPGQYLRAPASEVVLSIALGRAESSRRFKEIVRPSRRHWMHHLDLRDAGEIDEQVVSWLREAYDRAD